jgi:hypothetical protein
MRLNRKLGLCVLILILVVTATTSFGLPQDQPQEGQGQAEKDQQQKKKKKSGGIFGGLKAITGESSEQTEVTATAGSKSVGEGEKIGNVTPTAADRQQVKAIEDYSVPEKDVKKFREDGHLQPKQ